MADHRFEVGQTVRLTNMNRLSAGAQETFRIVATLPESNDMLQYRIRSDKERHERVTTEDNLETVDAPSPWSTLQ